MHMLVLNVSFVQDFLEFFPETQYKSYNALIFRSFYFNPYNLSFISKIEIFLEGYHQVIIDSTRK